MKNTPINRFEIRELSQDEGSGWFITFPDLPGCISDGDTIEEAIENGADAEKAWLEANAEWQTEERSGKLNIRIPKSVHRQLANQAYRESVSINTLIVSYLSSAVSNR
ncbi:MAG: type II toxin-antitoxin system HicB family antitoxin [Deferribacteraceae bacterium]|jgi:antitoxin HicB|nr:type II toxin-antitoxin system HicB family antitoxin [Deferribacteraceae bacterium]